MDPVLLESMCGRIGQTVTIFTQSGGLSGSGFTGVLLMADPVAVRLLCSVGAAPSCAVGSTCGAPDGAFCGYGYGDGAYADGFYGGNPLGAVAVIPTHAIVCFTHNAI